MMPPADEAVLDDAAALERLDAGGMLRTIAGSGAQVREAMVVAGEAGLDALAGEGRPRALIVTGMGGSAISGDVLAAVAGPGGPVPVVVHRGYELPGWVGAADVVAAVSCSGRTEETLSAAQAAADRGSRLFGVGAVDSPLEEVVRRAGGPYVPVPSGRMPRASMWALAVPLLVAADHLRLLTVPEADLAATADLLDAQADACRPGSESFVNPAKQLAVELAGTLPMVWGSSPLAGVAAARFATQLAENAKYPAISGVLPEANHNQVVALEGAFGGLGRPAEPNLFADRADGVAAGDAVRLRLILLRDLDEHPQVLRRVEASRLIAEVRGVAVSEMVAEGTSRLERLASLVAVPDFASTYLGLLYGLDPTPIAPIAELKDEIARR